MLAIQYIGKLALDWMLEHEGIIVESDNASVIDFMQNFKARRLWKQKYEDAEDWSWLRSFQHIIFVHTYRRFNMAAHYCAHRAIEDNFLWDIGDSNICIPQEFLDILEDDSSSFV
ncbi:hypothetical protein MA16_Dca002886 [Dendrobium catenatum]|uniref:RNase H type-1 domain-containing protein n=1 Tax=Dendrobium catenatum TaxID=906689 RepID=A0A2I0X8Y4_9ASPA|nr:hypothetical protein MA16_Dca002886 [Dendrobium catenatum]